MQPQLALNHGDLSASASHVLAFMWVLLKDQEGAWHPGHDSHMSLTAFPMFAISKYPMKGIKIA